MDMLLSYWLAVVVSAVFVFIASSLIWMATPIHKHDYKDPGDKEGAILDFVRGLGLPPGLYYVPRACHGKPDPATQETVKRGPWAMLSVLPGMPSMGKMLGMWFVHLLFMTALIACALTLAYPAGASHRQVIHLAAVTGFLAFGGYSIPLCVWHGMPWSQLPGRLFDGVVYTVVAAFTFGWLAPQVALIPG